MHESSTSGQILPLIVPMRRPRSEVTWATEQLSQSLHVGAFAKKLCYDSRL